MGKGGHTILPAGQRVLNDSHLSLGKPDRQHIGRLRKEDNLLAGNGGGRGVGDEPNSTTGRESLVLYKSYQILSATGI
jgi:hypothetical protein